MNFPPAYPHDPIEAIDEHVFMVRGSIPLNPVMRISRNMAIVRQGDELTVINPLRLDDSALGELDRLGRVRHVLRLGPLHGIDDPYYMERYKAQLWALPGGKAYPQPPVDHALSAAGELPFDGGELFVFEQALQPEGALLLGAKNRLLLTCDAIQHYGDYSHNNLPARLLMPFIGFPRRVIVGPIWLKMMTPEGGSLRGDFSRLLQLSFERLLAAHGTLLASGAHAAVTVAVAHAFRD